MTNEERVRANEALYPALVQRVENIQSKAMRLEAVLEVVNYLESEGQCENGRHALSIIAQELADDIGDLCDTQNLPKVTA